MRFGVWMRTKRRASGRSMAQCAKDADDMAVQYWCRLEKHTEQPEYKTVVRVARGLNVPEGEALAVAGYSVPAEVSPVVQISEIVSRMRPDEQVTVLRLVRALAADSVDARSTAA